MAVNPQFLYDVFSDVYYEHEYPTYTDYQVSTTESVQCLLKSFLNRKYHRRLLDQKIVILSFGKIIHLAVQKSLLHYGYQAEVEKPYPISDIELFTHADALHQTHGLELKTISTMPNEVLSHHYLQSNTYMTVHQKPEWYIGYIHKPSGIIKTFPIQQSNTAFQYVVLRAIRLSNCLRRNTLPNAEPDWLCQYCEYIDICPNPKRYVSKTGGL